jgi:hypothetical protein
MVHFTREGMPIDEASALAFALVSAVFVLVSVPAGTVVRTVSKTFAVFFLVIFSPLGL